MSYVPFEDFDFASHANEVAGVADGTEILYTAMIAPQLDALRGAIEERGIDTPGLLRRRRVRGERHHRDPNNEGVYWTDHGFGEDGNRFERLNAALEAAGMPSAAPGFAALAGRRHNGGHRGLPRRPTPTIRSTSPRPSPT